jgi:hypothetical protein
MDEDEIRQYQQRRETFLTVFLTLLAGTGIVLFLTLVTWGFFLYVLLGCLAVAVCGYIHYLLWGKLFSSHVAGEREEMEAQAEDENEEVVAAVKEPGGRRHR